MWVAQWNALMRRARCGEPLPDEARSLMLSLLAHGVPPQHRAHVWMSLTGALALRRASRRSYWEMAADAEAVVTVHSKQVDSDLPRTFPQHADFGDDGPTRTALRRILVTYA